jgi:hypothetical protein
MRKDDARKLNHKTLEAMRMRAPELVEGEAYSRRRKCRDHRPCSWCWPVDRPRMAGARPAWRLLAQPGMTCRDPVASCARAGRGFGSAMAAWFGGLTRLSGNQANGAKSRCRDIFRRRHAHPLRSSRRPRLGQKRRNAGCRGTGARPGMSLLSAISSRGHMRFMIKQQGGVNAAVFIAPRI